MIIDLIHNGATAEIERKKAIQAAIAVMLPTEYRKAVKLSKRRVRKVWTPEEWKAEKAKGK